MARNAGQRRADFVGEGGQRSLDDARFRIRPFDPPLHARLRGSLFWSGLRGNRFRPTHLPRRRLGATLDARLQATLDARFLPP